MKKTLLITLILISAILGGCSSASYTLKNPVDISQVADNKTMEEKEINGITYYEMPIAGSASWRYGVNEAHGSLMISPTNVGVTVYDSLDRMPFTGESSVGLVITNDRGEEVSLGMDVLTSRRASNSRRGDIVEVMEYLSRPAQNYKIVFTGSGNTTYYMESQ